MKKIALDQAYDLEKIEEKNRKELRDVFLSKSKYHQKNWNAYKEGKNNLNWAPFLIGGFWFLFKGMLLSGAIYIMLILGIIFLMPDSMDILLRAIFTSVNGLIIYKGNSLYYDFIEKKIDKVMLSLEDQAERIRQLKKEKFRNTIIGILVAFVFLAFVIWGMLYMNQSKQIDQYFQAFDQFEIEKFETIVTEHSNKFLKNSDDYTDKEILIMLNEKIIPNQTEIVERLNQFELSEDIMTVHKIAVTAEKLKLEGFTTIRDGLEQYDSEMVATGLKLLEKATDKTSEFELELTSLLEY